MRAMVLAVVAVVVALAAGQGEVAVQESPVMPPGLEDCPVACVEVLECLGYPSCNAWCVETMDLDVDPPYVSHCPDPGLAEVHRVYLPLIVGDGR